jgi:rare lipoprotein A
MACVAWLMAAACAREGPVGVPSDVKGPGGPSEVGLVDEPPAGSKGQVGMATYYAQKFIGRRTANGERYDPGRLTAAHRTLPFGTFVEVRRHDGRKVIVRINDRGPYAKGRIIDLSRKAAELIGLVRDGVAEVELRTVAAPPSGD